MAYTPEFDLATVRIVRRIAWAMNVPMTVALPSIIQWIATRLDPGKMCSSCRSPVGCGECPFNKPKTPSSRSEQGGFHA